MDYLKDLKVPFLLSAAIFVMSFLSSWRVDFYGIILATLYFIFGSISNVGSHYLTLTQQKESSKKLLKCLADPLAAFLLILGASYAYFGEFNWILTGTAIFLALILFVITLFDWSDERMKEKTPKEVSSADKHT